MINWRKDPSWRDRRVEFRSPAGHVRALYARRWRGGWECQLCGYGMQPRIWWSATQSGAISSALLSPAIRFGQWKYTGVQGRVYDLWDGYADAWSHRGIKRGQTYALFGAVA